MTEIGQAVASGVVSGALIGLIALGISVMYRTTGIINFAYGDLVVIGGYLVVALDHAGWPLAIAIAIAMLAVGVLMSVIERAILQPLYRLGLAYPIVATVGIAVALESTILLIAGAAPQFVPTLVPSHVMTLGFVRLTSDQLLVCLLSVVACGAAIALINFTRLGRALRAVAVDRYAASILGIPVKRYFTVAFFIGAALAALAGGMLGDVTNLSPTLGLSLSATGFTAAVIGGLGNPGGALLGGMILGVFGNLAVIYISPSYKEGITMVALLVFLLARPTGLFGEPAAHGRAV